jgi:uncharacterized membrane protein YfcA
MVPQNARTTVSGEDGALPAPPALAFAALAIAAGYVVFGVTGFGASPITIPLLAHVLPLTFALPLAAILDVGSALAVGIQARRQAHGRELLALVPFTLAGLALGVTVLVNLPRRATVLALGLFVCAYALHLIVRRRPARRVSRRWAVAAGLAGGVLGALFGMGGPPYVMYIAGRIPDPAAQRATISLMVILNVGLCVIAFALAGLLASPRLWTAVAILLPVAWMGVRMGHRIHVRLAPAAMARIVGGALLVAGGTLLARAL